MKIAVYDEFRGSSLGDALPAEARSSAEEAMAETISALRWVVPALRARLALIASNAERMDAFADLRSWEEAIADLEGPFRAGVLNGSADWEQWERAASNVASGLKSVGLAVGDMASVNLVISVTDHAWDLHRAEVGAPPKLPGWVIPVAIGAVVVGGVVYWRMRA